MLLQLVQELGNSKLKSILSTLVYIYTTKVSNNGNASMKVNIRHHCSKNNKTIEMSSKGWGQWCHNDIGWCSQWIIGMT